MSPSWPVGGDRADGDASEPAAAKSSAAPNAPRGVQRPKMSAASAMKPRPLVMPVWKVVP